jgi:16S rRNA (uracil1498-N3)-methyltransferase
VVLFDSEGIEYLAKIETLNRKQTSLSIEMTKKAKPNTSTLTIACAIPKKSRMDDIVDKLTQLGVDEIVPLITARVIVKLEKNSENRLERWRKVALSASEQSQRNKLPVISPILNFKEILAISNQYLFKLIPTLSGQRKNIREVISSPFSGSILVLIGPEGDFSQEEVRQAEIGGFIPVSLGENVLKVDTAAIAAASYIRFTLT